MNRDEILERNKADNQKDEGIEYIDNKAGRYGEVGLCIFFILLVIYNFAKGKPVSDLLALFWGYLGMGYIYKFRANKTNRSLISAICGMVAAFSFLLAYVFQTW